MSNKKNKENYFTERQEKAVEDFLRYGKKLKIYYAVIDILYEKLGDIKIDLEKKWEDFEYWLQKQEDKDAKKLKDKKEAKEKGDKWSNKTWEKNNGWLEQPSIISNLEGIYPQDVKNLFNIKSISKELPVEYNEVKKWYEDLLYNKVMDINKKREEIFRDELEDTFEKLVEGVLSMPKFQKIMGSREELKEEGYFHLIKKLDTYDPDRVNEYGQKTKAYSFYGTIVKNFLIQQKTLMDRKANTTVSDSDVALELTPDDNEGTIRRFDELRNSIIYEINKDIRYGEYITGYDKIVGSALIYMLRNWHKINFEQKNQFVRLLSQYCQLKQEVIARSLKKFRSAYERAIL